MRHGSLFSGIDGFALAAECMGWENVFHVENDKWAQKLLKQNFPNSKAYGEIEGFNGQEWRGQINVLSGGFPCQDISTAGFGFGIGGKKSGLWNQYARIIQEINPEYVVIENSTQLLRKGFEKVIYDLSEIGYDAEWECLSASEFGYPHKRERIFIVAYPNVQGWRGILRGVKRGNPEKDEPWQTNTLGSPGNPFLQFEQSYGEPAIFGMANGVSKRLDVVKRLGGCGNAIIPLIAYEIFKAIEQYETLPYSKGGTDRCLNK